jgi:Mg2+/Co2+ transporter CorB
MKTTLLQVKRAGKFKCNASHLNKMCAKIKQRPQKFYEIIEEYGGIADTVTREKIFEFITDKYNDGNYAKIYDLWLQRA